MKNSKKIYVLLAVACILAGITANKVEAKNNKVITLAMDHKAYQYDLNGDGKKDTIKCSSICDEDTSKIGYILTVNGKTVKKSYHHFPGDVCLYLIDTNSKDKYKELYLQAVGEVGEYFDGIFYRYNGKELTKYSTTSILGDLSAFPWIKSSQAGNGVITYVIDTPLHSDGGYLGNYYVDMSFKIKGSKLVLEKQDSYSTTSEWQKKEYVATKSFTAMTTKGGKKKAFEMNHYDTFHLLKVSGKNGKAEYIYIKDAAGKKGWVKVPKDMFYEIPEGGTIYQWS